MPVVGIVLGLLLVVVAIAGGVLLWGRMRSGLPGICRMGEGRGRVQDWVGVALCRMREGRGRVQDWGGEGRGRVQDWGGA